MTHKKIALIISVISICLGFWVNETNLKYLKYAGVELRDGQTVKTRDDESYLQPMQHLVKTGKLYTHEVEKYSSIVRSPGYGFVYAFFLFVFGASQALFFLKIFQVLMFGVSVYCLFFIATWVLKRRVPAIVATVLYGCIPLSMGFLYYTLTEALTPALVIFYLFFLLYAERTTLTRNSYGYYFFAAMIFACLFVIRPFMGILGLALPVFLTQRFFSRKNPMKWAMSLVFYGAVSLSLMLSWQIRNYAVFGKITGLHPIYQNEIPGTYRPAYKAIWGLFKGWEDKGAHFHQAVIPLWQAAIEGDTASRYVEATLSEMPEGVVSYFGKGRLCRAFKAYQQSTLMTRPYYDQNLPMPSTLSEEELIVVRLFNEMEQEYRHEFWFTYHVITPLKVFKNMLFHSNLSLYMFQYPLRGNVLMESLRLLCFCIYVTAFGLNLFFIFFSKNKNHVFVFWLCTVLYLFILAYIQRGIEERYLLPLLPIAIIAAAYVADQIIARILSRSKPLSH